VARDVNLGFRHVQPIGVFGWSGNSILSKIRRASSGRNVSSRLAPVVGVEVVLDQPNLGCTSVIPVDQVDLFVAYAKAAQENPSPAAVSILAELAAAAQAGIKAKQKGK
jgi:hypothetical protein